LLGPRGGGLVACLGLRDLPLHRLDVDAGGAGEGADAVLAALLGGVALGLELVLALLVGEVGRFDLGVGAAVPARSQGSGTPCR